VTARPLLRQPAFLRLWVAGGLAGALLWLEILAAGLFTLDLTGSAFAVAIVSAARSLPLLGFGAVVGVLADRHDRRAIVLGGLLLTAAASGSVAALAFAGLLRPWELCVAALANGFVYATELPARRRLIAEVAPHALLGRAIAIDSLTSFGARCAGPLIGGVLYGGIGVAGTFAASAAASLIGAALIAGLPRPHVTEPGETGQTGSVVAGLIEGARFAVRHPRLRTMLGVTMAMNLFGYAYSGLVAPMGRAAFTLSDPQIGVLAATEPGGALAAGLVFAWRPPTGRPVAWLAGGVALFMTALLAVGLSPSKWFVSLALFVAGFGSASFTNHQSTIAIAAAPGPLRSRVLGLVTACIGLWPIGLVIAGGLTQLLSAQRTIAMLALVGLTALAASLWIGRARAGD